MNDRPIMLMRRSMFSLRPISRAAEDALRSIEEGSTVVIEIKKSARNQGRHRLYWALLTVAADNLPTEGMDAELLHALLKQKLGLGHWVQLPSGDKIFDPRSTAFSKMSEPEFAAYFERVNKVLAQWLKVDPQVLLDEAHQEAA